MDFPSPRAYFNFSNFQIDMGVENNQSLLLLKIGGKTIDDNAFFATILDRFAEVRGPKILIHGGGSQTTAMCQQMGIPVRMIDGRRITDEATLKVVTMLYAGWINKTVVGNLQKRNCNAIGLSGADGNVVLAEKRRVRTIDYGYAGDVLVVDETLLTELLDLGLVPVLCAITHDRNGQLLNTNADTIAFEAASAMAPGFRVKLWYCMELKGVYTDPNDPSSIIPHLNASQYRYYKDQKIISGGMIPKLDNAFAALREGVVEVAIGNIDTLFDRTCTKITV